MKNLFRDRISELVEAADLARASYTNEASPEGWKRISLNSKFGGLDDKYFNAQELSYVNPKADPEFFPNGISATVFRSGKEIAISFRGTDNNWDYLDYRHLLTGDLKVSRDYIDLFRPLLRAVWNEYGPSFHYTFTGHSLGAAAVSQLSSFIDNKPYRMFKNHSDFYGIANPVHSRGVFNFGFDNDIIYELAKSAEIGRSTIHAIIVNSQADATRYNDDDSSASNVTAHDKTNYVESLRLLQQSVLVDKLLWEDYIFIVNTTSDIQLHSAFDKLSNLFYVIGNNDDNKITSYISDEKFDLGEGNDELKAGGGNDIIYGGIGEDILNGEIGADTIYGGNDDDVLEGGEGLDKLYGEKNDDTFLFRSGDIVTGEIIDGGSVTSETNTILLKEDVNFSGAIFSAINNIDLDGHEGKFTSSQITALSKTGVLKVEASGGSFVVQLDNARFDASVIDFGSSSVAITIRGSGSDDTIFGAQEISQIYGEGGNDNIAVGNKNDTVYGGAGNDLVVALGGGDTIFGEGGNDTLFGRLGSDTIYGGADNDSIDGGEDNDKIFGDGGHDTIHGGSENDSIEGGAGNDVIYGDDGNDYITGGEDGDTIHGGSGTNSLYGGSGTDTIYGGIGSDEAYGGSGGDNYFDETGTMNIHEVAGEGYDGLFFKNPNQVIPDSIEYLAYRGTQKFDRVIERGDVNAIEVGNAGSRVNNFAPRIFLGDGQDTVVYGPNGWGASIASFDPDMDKIDLSYYNIEAVEDQYAVSGKTTLVLHDYNREYQFSIYDEFGDLITIGYLRNTPDIFVVTREEYFII